MFPLIFISWSVNKWERFVTFCWSVVKSSKCNWGCRSYFKTFFVENSPPIWPVENRHLDI